jgi:uncharacterized protein YccT (UPF0319 family)
MIYGCFNKIICFFLCSISISHAFAVELIVPDTYKLIKVNGKKTSSNFFSSETVIDLKYGENVLIVQFSDLFENVEDDDHMTIKSEPQVVLFNLNENAIEKYFIVAPTFSDSIEARKFAESPLIEIKYTDEKSGKNMSMSVLNQSLTGFKADIAFKQMVKQDLLTKKMIGNIPKNPKIKSTEDALIKLKSWWDKADKIQQKRFVEYIQQ